MRHIFDNKFCFFSYDIWSFGKILIFSTIPSELSFPSSHS